MNARRGILLSPYKLPTDSTLYVGDDEIASILEGHAALWHPAALAHLSGVPRLEQKYEHDSPAGDVLYAFPEAAPMYMADDWSEQARSAGAVVVRAPVDRAGATANLFEALAGLCETDDDRSRLERLKTAPEDAVRALRGIGLGITVLEALFEAMSHDNVLSYDDLGKDVKAAVDSLLGDDPEAWRGHVQSAADRLLAAREVVYPVTLYLVELSLPVVDAPLSTPMAKAGLATNVLLCGSDLAKLAESHPDYVGELKAGVEADAAEVVGGVFLEREDPLLPLESQLWNLRTGLAVSEAVLGKRVKVFGRRKTAFHAQTPLLLQNVGIAHALHVAFDDAVVPSHTSPVVSWPSHDGKQVEAFTRLPQPADTPQTVFHLAHHLHQTIMQDQSATLVFAVKDKPAGAWYDELAELTRFAPVFGRPVTLSTYFSEVSSGDYTSAVSPDEFHADTLNHRTAGVGPDDAPKVYDTDGPITDFVGHTRDRRKVDAAWTYAALLKSVRGTLPEIDGRPFEAALTDVEDAFESGRAAPETVDGIVATVASALAARLTASGAEGTPGFLVLNPCSFPRRAVVELPGLVGTLPGAAPVKACQDVGGVPHAVVELPPLGFVWLPKVAPPAPAASATAAKMKLADEKHVRNEFFEAEIDPQTGGLKGVRDQRVRIGRVGLLLVYNPGSNMKATSVETTSAGPALGEIVTSGVIENDNSEQIATFKIRYRAWLGRPLLEIKIDVEPAGPCVNYPWHEYFAARFGWRDEGVGIVRGCMGLRSPTSQTRPETPDYLELRVGKPNTVIFPGGLPFHQRQGSRMLDVLLICEGEKARSFELGVGLDRDQPMQTALGIVSPVSVVAVGRGAPRVGNSSWLALLDASNVMLSTLKPAADGSDAVVATMLECGGYGGPATFRFVRDPVRAVVQDLTGSSLYDAGVEGDAATIDLSGNDLSQLRVEFG